MTKRVLSMVLSCQLSSVACTGALAGGTVNVRHRVTQLAVRCLVTVNGTPLAGARCDTEGHSGLTDIQGEYRFAAVPAGRRVMVASKDGYQSGRTDYQLTIDGQTVAVSMVLKQR